MLAKLEKEIRPLVEEFIAAGKPCASKLSIEERRAGYLSSVSLAGKSSPLFAKYETRLNGYKVKVYQPVEGTNLPLCVYFHGGCFVSGGFLTHDQQLSALAAQSACIFVCVEYRLAPEHLYPAAHDDAYFATLAIKEHAKELGGCPHSICLMGDSAGGHLALITALRLRDKGQWQANKLALIYPMLDPNGASHSYVSNGTDYIITRQMLLSGFDLYMGERGDDENNPELNVLASHHFDGLPPTHIVTAEFDPLLGEGILLFQRLKAAGVKASHETYDGVIHGFFQLAGVSPSAVRCLHSLSQWISH